MLFHHQSGPQRPARLTLLLILPILLLTACDRNRPDPTPAVTVMPVVIATATMETPQSDPTAAPTLAQVLVPTPVPVAGIPDHTGQLLKSDGPAVYRLMEDGTLRHIPTWADFVGLGFEDVEIITLEDDELAGYVLGPPLVQDGPVLLSAEERSPLHNVTAAAVQPMPGQALGTLWLGTAFAGVFACPWPPDLAPTPVEIATRLTPSDCAVHTTFTGDLLDNSIHDLLLDDDGSVWVASPGGVSHYRAGTWQAVPLAAGVTTRGALALARANDGSLWVGGDGYIAQREVDGGWAVHTAVDQPLLDDAFGEATVNEWGELIMRGQKRTLRYDGVTWRAYGLNNAGADFVEFRPDPLPPAGVTPPPLDFPDPRTVYMAWLQQWPRPAADNGRCFHFVQASWLDVDDAQRHIDRLVDLDARWTVVPYANHFQLRRLAPLFADAGITVVWRPFVRPYEQYDWWKEDVTYLREHGYPPYMQLYNEPSLAQEWDAPHTDDDPPMDQATYWANLLPAMQTVYDAGGYVGLQFISPEWTRATLKHLVASGMEPTFDRLFFVPHPYGLNHPPDYAEDESAVLGFRHFGDIFAQEIGFTPMMIAGEGGWRPGEQQDNRYPPVSQEDHRDFHVAVFEWFRTGTLSDGAPLPDALFAFCPWLIADPVDSAGWYESRSGDRTLAIEAVLELPPFTRRFSWE